MSKKSVLLFGATGWLGGKIARECAKRSAELDTKAFVRGSSNTKTLDELKIGTLSGNLLDKDSIVSAMDPKNFGGKPVDAVIYSAASYTGRQSGDSQKRDQDAFNNVVAAFKIAGAKRFVLVSIVGCDLATSVPHFHDKYLFEQILAKEKISFVSLRAPAFLDQDPSFDFNIASLAKDFFPVLYDPSVKIGFVFTDDFAVALVKAAADIPQADLPLTLNYSIDSNLSANDVAAEFSKVLGRPITPKSPMPFVNFFLSMAGKFNANLHDLATMFEFFNSGKYTLSEEEFKQGKKYFEYSSLNSAVTRYVKSLQARGHTLSPQPAGWGQTMALATLVAGAGFAAYRFLNAK